MREEPQWGGEWGRVVRGDGLGERQGDVVEELNPRRSIWVPKWEFLCG